MRSAGTLTNAAHAERLCDYLLTLGIETRIAPEDNTWTLWVLDDDHLTRVKEILSKFQQNPSAAEFVRAADRAAEIRRNELEAARQARRNFVDMRSRWVYGVRGGHRPLTWALIGLSILATVVTGMGSDNSPVTRWLVMASYEIGGGYVRWAGLSEIRAGQLWRLVTPIFIHFNVLHIIFNMFWLRDLGSLIEVRKGSWFLGVLTLVIAVLSNLVQYLWSGPNFGGMSGVVYGLLGYVWIKGRLYPSAGLSLQGNTVTIMLAWLGLCFTGLLGPIANGAHVGGLAVGCAIAYAGHLVANVTTRKPKI